jgi:thiol:disulfide interchange protein DsbD
MSMGMGAPLLLVGAGAGKFMPKPGGWMDTVSKVFGVVMLGVAVWMLERIIPAMATMILWSLLFIGSSWFVLKSKKNIIKIFGAILFIYGFILALGAGSGSKNPINPLEYLGSSNISHGLKFTRVKSVDELDQIIKNTKKPIMLDFYANWCISCKELEETTFKDKNVIKMLEEFTLLQVDTTKNTQNDKDLLTKFNLFGPPGIIFWDKDGKMIDSAKLVGYKNSEEFIKHIKRYYK